MMQLQGLQPDMITCTLSAERALQASEEVRLQGLSGMDLQFFEERWQDRFRPNGITYSNLISACGEDSVPVRALHLSGEMRHNELQPNAIAYHAVIKA